MGEPVPRREAITIGVPRETAPDERRAAVNVDAVKKMVKAGLNVVIQSGTGDGSFISDEEYQDAGATIVPGVADVYQAADIILKINSPQGEELGLLQSGSILISYLQPLTNHELVQTLAGAGVTAFSMDAIPRTTRAQYMDALSSQSNLAGYKAVIMAAYHLPKIFPLMMTAAGTIAPARALVIGAGVAGLQAIGTARRLGARVEAYDTRPVVKEQVESLGATFVEVEAPESETQDSGGYAKEASAELLRRQQEVLAQRAIAADFVITTAAVPGRPAPRLISADTVSKMRPGSVIVDLASETGGNCELTQPGEIIVEHGVTIVGIRNVPSTLSVHATQSYAKNLQNFLDLMIDKSGNLTLNFDDDIVGASVITYDGEIVHEGTRSRMGLAPLAVPEPEPEPEPEAPSSEASTDRDETLETVADIPAVGQEFEATDQATDLPPLEGDLEPEYLEDTDLAYGEERELAAAEPASSAQTWEDDYEDEETLAEEWTPIEEADSDLLEAEDTATDGTEVAAAEPEARPRRRTKS